MKKMLALIVASAIWLSGCQKNDSTLTPTDESATFESITSAAARFAVEGDSVTVSHCKGKLTELAVADLASAVSTYISTHYPDATVQFAGADTNGKIVVAIKLADGSVKGLLFNSDGTFSQELLRTGKLAKLTEIAVNNLPTSITSYIDTNYAGAEIKKAATNTDGDFLVAILADGKVKVLLFKADGTFEKELEKPAFRPGKPGHGKGK